MTDRSKTEETGDGHRRGWILAALALVIIILAGTGSVWMRHDRGGAVEIVFIPEPEPAGSIYAGGAVNVPGYYPLKPGDSLGDIIRAAGGLAEGADPDDIDLIIGGEPGNTSQRVNINTAGLWLLTALPGIGEGRAQAIIDYREENGFFRDSAEITAVEGIGDGLYRDIRDLITVAE